jgi:hypothetical protein
VGEELLKINLHWPLNTVASLNQVQYLQIQFPFHREYGASINRVVNVFFWRGGVDATMRFIFLLVVCLTTGPKCSPNRALQYSLLCLRLSSSFLRLPLRLPFTSIPLLSFLQ